VSDAPTDERTKEVDVETKIVGDPEDRVVRIIASDATEDRDGDIIEPEGGRLGWFRDKGSVLWAHNKTIPSIAKPVKVGRKSGRIFVDSKFKDPSNFAEGDPHAMLADHVFRSLKQGFDGSASIGFRPLEGGVEKRPEGGFRFTDWEMLELSVLTVGSNRSAGPKGMQDAFQKAADAWSKAAEESAPDSEDKAGRTLSKANIERVKRIVRAALEMAADEGIDVDTIVTEAMEEVETDGMDEDDKSVDPDVKMPGAGVRREVRGLLQAKDNALGAMKDLVKSDQPVSEGAVSRQMRQLVRQDMRRNRTIMEAMGAGGDDGGGEMEGRDAPDSGIVEKAATDFQDLPLAARDREWDGAAAVGRWREFTGSEDEPSDDYWQNFMWWDAKSGENFGAYKLPYGDIIDGDHVAVPRAIFAIAAALEGARGGVDIPGEDADAVRGHVTQYYAKMRDAFDDDSIIAPWNAEESFDDWQDMQREALGIEGKGVVELAWQDDNGGGENDEDQIIELAFSQDADGGGAGDDDESSVFEIAE